MIAEKESISIVSNETINNLKNISEKPGMILDFMFSS